ncbi:hypothetical protein AX15_003837 [Amanita polypyramis BW_CC]|nr:hypothetical protein AX15_003837 [Amanita polypyramis BW_CC]
MSAPSSGRKVLKRANPSTIQGKFLVGYQGWFTCAGDGEPVGPGHHGWLHWFNYPLPDGGRPNVDLWPDVSTYSPSELFAAPGLRSDNGEQLFLFSSRHPKTVQRHFHWMAEHGIDGAFLQRFLGQCDLDRGNEGIRRIRDEIGDRVAEAAEKEGRVFAVMYDISGVDPNRILDIIERDWIHLLHEKYVLDSPNYLREKGKIVIALWGFGFDKTGHTPEIVRAVTAFLRDNTPGGAYIMAGVPSQWRTSEGDADRNKKFLDVWLNEFDAISPWTVGRYSNEDEADRFADEKIKGDIDLLKRRYESGLSKKIDYIPVVLPGGSGYNLSEGKWGFNNIKRNGGHFLWRQIYNGRRLGARIMYGAMWDEYDEGTAFLPAVANKRLLPVHDKFPFLSLDADGHDLPSDWYMRICGLAAEGLRNDSVIHEAFPSKELQDYWTRRPKFEEYDKEEVGQASTVPSGSDSSTLKANAVQSYQEWLASQTSDKAEAPPPPYTLVEEEGQASHRPAAAATHDLSQAPVSPSATSSPTAAVSSSASPITPSLHMGQTSSHHPATNDPVTSLTEALGRQTITGTPDQGPLSRLSRPPIHPAHPAAPYLQMPRPSGPSSSQPSYPLRPSSAQPQVPQAQMPEMDTSLPPLGLAMGSGESPSSASLWSQARWPPPGWNLPPRHDPNCSYPGQMNNSQPYQTPDPSLTGSPTEPLLMPHSPIGTPPVRPYSSLHYPPPNFPVPSGEPYRPPPQALHPGRVSPHQFSSPSSNATSPGSIYPGQIGIGGGGSSYSEGYYPGAYPGPRPYTSPSHYNQGNSEYYPNQFSSHSSPSSEGYQSQQHYYGSGYPHSSHHESHHQAHGAPSHGVNSHHPTGQQSSTFSPPGPGRPYSKPHAGGTSSGSPNPTSGNAINYAMSAAQRVAGQLEQRTGSLTQSGTKLFNKLTR